MLAALGFSMTNQPQVFAINSYFLQLRGRAVSLSVGVCGFGPVLIPLLTARLLDWYTPEGAMMVLAALVLHSLVASTLLQPVREHAAADDADVAAAIGAHDREFARSCATRMRA